MIHLYLSSPSAINSLYVTAAGHPIFKVDTPRVSLGETRRTIIRRAVDTVDGVWLGDEEKDSREDLGETVPSFHQALGPSPGSEESSDPRLSFEGHFAHLAHIEYTTLKPSRILYAGREMQTNKVFKAKGWSWYSLSRNKVFRASDGCEYHWVIGTKCQTLVTNDTCKTVVARFYYPKQGFTMKRDTRQSFLEVYQEGEHILNDILITFVYTRDAAEN